MIPISTDAPLYHRPWGTLAMVATNIGVFVATAEDPALLEYLSLPYGVGFTPLQWITSNFVHFGILHLVWNMVFLWSFGLVVEGKLGWKAYLPLYLGIGVLQCFIEQALFWNSEGLSGGASAIIFGLMVICLIWAPENEFSCIFIFAGLLFMARVIDVRLIWFCGLRVAWSLILIWWFWPYANSAMLHVMGGVIGGVAGWALLHWNLVDCEGWDLMSRMAGKPLPSTNALSAGVREDLARRQQSRRAARKRKVPDAETQASQVSVERFRNLIEDQKPHAAYQELRQIRHFQPDWMPPVQDLLFLARGQRKLHRWDESVALYEQVLQLAPSTVAAALELAEILILVQQRPNAAVRVLNQAEIGTLSASQAERWKRLEEEIAKLKESGVLEIDFGH